MAGPRTALKMNPRTLTAEPIPVGSGLSRLAAKDREVWLKKEKARKRAEKEKRDRLNAIARENDRIAREMMGE